MKLKLLIALAMLVAMPAHADIKREVALGCRASGELIVTPAHY